MTHVKNIPHILKHGITHQNSPNKNPDYVQIGFPGLITKREKVIVLGRNKLSDYIPFYFGYRMPMLYVIKHGNNSATYNMNSISNEDVVYCITNLDQIINHGLGFAFSNGHALSAFTDFFNVEDVGKYSQHN
ncbi:DarT ssDNA thymidine ADP-ribosyltransferase family protein [Mucilaginibacter sp. UR6-1]|uniref:DarT ssDNA thymidine ADP-ribosyltransferase family protein n=1 Tax=Mucilaginibacter sp. UR6-1 TaxID=1435643 RepID=UPI002101DBEE|nr:DarT ssDNA thymidine ADP-ribosyltransferase family protein [Mucilaginibacter sp. UR6-1]